jgi:hypothetical protein
MRTHLTPFRRCAGMAIAAMAIIALAAPPSEAAPPTEAAPAGTPVDHARGR